MTPTSSAFRVMLSGLRTVPGVAHICPIPVALQSNVWGTAAIPTWSREPELSRSAIRFLCGDRAGAVIELTGLQAARRQCVFHHPTPHHHATTQH